MQLSQKRKHFSEFLFHFWNLHLSVNVFRKRTIVIANVFPKLQAVEILLRPLFKNRRFHTRIESQHMKASKILAKSPGECFCHVFDHSQGSSFQKCLP